jgi:hypothetical protein
VQPCSGAAQAHCHAQRSAQPVLLQAQRSPRRRRAVSRNVEGGRNRVSAQAIDACNALRGVASTGCHPPHLMLHSPG